MNEYLLRESNYRGEQLTRILGATQITVCGAGALGSNFVHEIMRQGAMNVTVIDDDRVEAHNISTQMYAPNHVGQLKTNALGALMWILLRQPLTSATRHLTRQNCARLLKGAALVVDTFDNSKSSYLVWNWCIENDVPCLRRGMSEVGMYGQVAWPDGVNFTVDIGTDLDPCDVPATRNLISITVALGCEAVMRWLGTLEKREGQLTLNDMHVTWR